MSDKEKKTKTGKSEKGMFDSSFDCSSFFKEKGMFRMMRQVCSGNDKTSTCCAEMMKRLLLTLRTSTIWRNG